MLTTATARHYMEEGFIVLPRVVSPRHAVEHSLSLQRHLEEHGDRYAMMMDGDKLGGWYIANFPGVPELAHLLEALTRDTRLSELLEDLLGETFHLLSRSEIYVDRQNDWHADGLYAAPALYNLPVIPSYRSSCAGGAARRPTKTSQTSKSGSSGSGGGRGVVVVGGGGVGSSSPPAGSSARPAASGPTRGPLAGRPSWAAGITEQVASLSARQCRTLEKWGPQQRETFFEADPDTNSTQRIVTVAIYLQDHSSDGRGLSVPHALCCRHGLNRAGLTRLIRRGWP